MKKTVATILVVLVSAGGLALLFSCGGGGGGGGEDGVVPPAESLTGTYALEYLYTGTFSCSGGTADGPPPQVQLMCDQGYEICDTADCSWNPGLVYDTDSDPSIAGTMVLTEDSIYQILTFNGQSSLQAASYGVVYTNPTTEGVLTYDSQSGPPAMSFLCSGNSLSFFGTGRMSILQVTIKIVAHQEWLKVSDEAVPLE